jgi:hypothetical protein
MQIDHYRFGRIGVAGQDYEADLIIFPNRVQPNWRRREGHCLERQDLASVLAEAPELLVIGTGYYGRMRVPEQALTALRDSGVEVRVAKTGDAVVEFNRLQSHCARIAAALHLTC